MAKEFILRLFLCFSLFLLAPRAAWAHLDPPGPPAVQEVIALLSLNVFDDMDTFASGELSVDYKIEQFKHATKSGVIPSSGYFSVSATGTGVPFPTAFPIVLYNHLNCNPSETPVTVTLVLKDADVTGWDKSPLSLSIRGFGPGAFDVTNGQFSYRINIRIIPRPEFNYLCQRTLRADEQPTPPDLTPEELKKEEKRQRFIGETESENASLPSSLIEENKDYRTQAILSAVAVGLVILLAKTVGRKGKKHKKGR